MLSRFAGCDARSLHLRGWLRYVRLVFELHEIQAATKRELYDALDRELSALLHNETDLIANAANTASLILKTAVSRWHRRGDQRVR